MFHCLLVKSRIVRGQEEIIFDGNATSVFLPGKDGEFEILDFHKPIVTLLKKGSIIVDQIKEIPIKGGVMKMNQQSLVALIDTE